MIGWVLTTVGFLMACGFWKGELFTGESWVSRSILVEGLHECEEWDGADDTALDDLSKELYSLGYQGQLIFGFLIFLTTIPPLPLYSTLMVLCGYTFGVWEGFVVSYIASLTGAILVFIVSRTLLRDVITKSYVPLKVGHPSLTACN
jgi:heme exporter protein D